MGCGNSKMNVPTAIELITHKAPTKEQFTVTDEQKPPSKEQFTVTDEQKPPSKEQFTVTDEQKPPSKEQYTETDLLKDNPSLEPFIAKIQPVDPGQYWTLSTPTDKKIPFGRETRQFQFPSFPPGPYWLGFPNSSPVGPVGPRDSKPNQRRRRRPLSERHGQRLKDTEPSETNEPPNSIPNSNQAQFAPPLYGPYWIQPHPPAQNMHHGAGSKASRPSPLRQAQQLGYSLPATQNALLYETGPTKPESPTPF